VIDAHAHLTDAAFEADRDAVLERARAAGVERVLTCGEDVTSSERALTLARANADLLRVAVGVHPHRAEGCDAGALGALRTLAADPLVVAIGEIGLDLSGRSALLADQLHAFSAQLGLAAELGLPVVVHMRDAASETHAALSAAPPVRGQLHCYSEGPGEVDSWTARGLVPSFAGTVTFRANARLREAAVRAPALLLETDAPYLAPEPRRGERNEPARVRQAYELVASLRGVGVDALARLTSRTARSLFGPRWD
jgi:TatD DNase family protein